MNLICSQNVFIYLKMNCLKLRLRTIEYYILFLLSNEPKISMIDEEITRN